MALVSINWRPTKKDYTQFALSLIIGFTVIAWGLWLFQGNLAATREAGSMVWGPVPYLWGVPVVIGLGSLAHPLFAKPFYFIWMGLAFVLGTVMSHVILGLFYYLMVTPTGFLLRLFGYDPLRIRKPVTGSNWTAAVKPSTKASCERLF